MQPKATALVVPEPDPRGKPIMEIVEGAPTTETRYVGRYSGYRHDSTLRDIDNLTALDPSLAGLTFELCSYTKETNALGEPTGRRYRCFKMTEEGFTLLAMGFLGAEASKLKRAFFAKFAEMHHSLRDEHNAYAKLNGSTELRRLLLSYCQKVEVLEKKVMVLKGYPPICCPLPRPGPPGSGL